MTTNFGKYTFYQNEPFSGQAEQNETIPQKVANNLFYTNINIKNKNGYDKA